MRRVGSAADAGSAATSDYARGAALLVWAAEGSAPASHANIIFWTGSMPDHRGRCITDLLESHGDEIRRRFLAWSHEFGATRVRGRPLREHFTFPDGASLWSQSLFVEQSAWKQPSVESILKLLMVELLLDSEMPVALHFAGADRNLSTVLGKMCRSRGIRYEWMKPRKRRDLSARGLARALPHLVQGILMLAYLAATRVTLRRPAPQEKVDSRRLLIVGQFFNFEVKSLAERPTFVSKFWTTLPALLEQAGYRITWLHAFYAHDHLRTPAAAAAAVVSINATESPNGTHALLDAYLTFRGVWKVLLRLISSSAESLWLGLSLQRQWLSDPALLYWPLLRTDWAKTFRGALCAENLVHAECFDRALRELPRQNEGLYIMENQGWERALAGSWKRHRHGRLAGVVHSTIRFWDLRYHCDSRQYEAAVREVSIGPDVVVVNGDAAREAYLSTAAIRETLVDCEALRYLHLTQHGLKRIDAAGTRRPLNLLVLGDYVRDSTEAVLRLLESIQTQCARRLDVRVKPHPACPVEPSRFPTLRFEVATGSVGELVHEADAVLTGNLTSAAVDAYASGARVFVHDDGNGLNYSPLRGIAGVAFVRTAEQLCEVLSALGVAGDTENSGRGVRRFFYSDAALPRWRRYLGVADACA